VTDVLAIVSRAVFEKDARAPSGKLLGVGDVWPLDRYNSSHKTFERVRGGGRIFLVTVRPDERLWFLGVVDAPSFTGSSWVAAKKNAFAITDITALRKTIQFESGKGMSQDKGTLGMSLQTPRALAKGDVAQILALAGGAPAPAPGPPPAALGAPSAPKAARVIGGKYELVREIGHGGMGVVHEAIHTGTGRRVAVKEILGDELREREQLVERFHREARAMGAIETDHIAHALDAGTDEATGHPFLVLELLRGEDLQALLARTGPLAEPVAVRIVAQACKALARAHEAGVVHRDIKPANVFLARRDGGDVVVKLLDFGIARVREGLAATDNRALTTTGLLLGSPLYMSPEQVLKPKDVDARTDLWSLGVVLWETLAGRTPWSEALETVGALFVTICGKPAPSVRELAPAASDAVAAVATKALEIDLAKRYASAEAMLADLAALAPGGFALDESMLVGAPRPAPDLAFAATESQTKR